MVSKSDGKATILKSKYHWPGDTGYLYTAKMLVEAGMMLLNNSAPGGVVTPAVAMGSDLVQRLEAELGATLELSESGSEVPLV